jgi:hypothetical protein
MPAYSKGIDKLEERSGYEQTGERILKGMGTGNRIFKNIILT